jgi:transcription elongation factor/antiterminator RfaH
MHWYCIYTKQKKENDVTELLDNAGFTVFNPKLKKKRYVRMKFYEVTEPLFPCYVFTKFKYPDDYKLITYTRGVRKIVGFPEPIHVPAELIDFIEKNSCDGIVKMRKNFKTGDLIEIKTGPFKGLAGIFQNDIKGKDRVAILLNSLAQAKIIIDRDLIGNA